MKNYQVICHINKYCIYCISFLGGQLLHISIFNSFFGHYCYCNSSERYCQCPDQHLAYIFKSHGLFRICTTYMYYIMNQKVICFVTNNGIYCFICTQKSPTENNLFNRFIPCHYYSTHSLQLMQYLVLFTLNPGFLLDQVVRYYLGQQFTLIRKNVVHIS